MDIGALLGNIFNQKPPQLPSSPGANMLGLDQFIPTAQAHEGQTHYVNGKPIDDSSPMPGMDMSQPMPAPQQPAPSGQSRVSMWSPNQSAIFESDKPDWLKSALYGVSDTLDKLPELNILPPGLKIPPQAQRKEDFMSGLVHLLGIKPGPKLAPVSQSQNQYTDPALEAMVKMHDRPSVMPNYLSEEQLKGNVAAVPAFKNEISDFDPQIQGALDNVPAAQINKIVTADMHTHGAFGKGGENAFRARYALTKTALENGPPIDSKDFYNTVNQMVQDGSFPNVSTGHLSHYEMMNRREMNLPPPERAVEFLAHLGTAFGPRLFLTPLGKFYNGILRPEDPKDAALIQQPQYRAKQYPLGKANDKYQNPFWSQAKGVLPQYPYDAPYQPWVWKNADELSKMNDPEDQHVLSTGEAQARRGMSSKGSGD